MDTKNIACIILAAGKGERMKSETPKVLHQVCGRPMLGYVLDLVKDLKISKTIAVLGHKHEEVRKHLTPGVEVVIQKHLLGTADAVKQALPLLATFKGTVLILYADIPLLTRNTISEFLQHHIKNNLDAALLTAKVENPAGYGRILRDKYASVCAIVEEKDADEFQKDIKEINTGIMCFNKDRLFAALTQVKPNNQKKEYYLTDVCEILYKDNYLLDGVNLKDINEALGVNSRLELAKANLIMRQRINEKFMKEGITILDPSSTFIDYGVKIGQDTVIYPFTVVEKNVKIGKHCFIGPFAHLRESVTIGDDVTVGNFTEIVRAKVGGKTFIKHFSYIGDTSIGRRVNIGAGTVTANFDGKNKNTILIKDDAFIGSDTVLVAPVKIGKNSKTGAGSIVVKNTNVADGAVVVGVPARPIKRSV